MYVLKMIFSTEYDNIIHPTHSTHSTSKINFHNQKCTASYNTINTCIILMIIIIVFMLVLPRGTHSKHYTNHNKHLYQTPEFIEANTFIGARKGYVFKTEYGKTGYYLDN